LGSSATDHHQDQRVRKDQRVTPGQQGQQVRRSRSDRLAGTCQFNYTGPDGSGDTGLNGNDLLIPGPLRPSDYDKVTQTLTFAFSLNGSQTIYTQSFALILMPSRV
jgi:hypothetical protein